MQFFRSIIGCASCSHPLTLKSESNQVSPEIQPNDNKNNVNNLESEIDNKMSNTKEIKEVNEANNTEVNNTEVNISNAPVEELSIKEIEKVEEPIKQINGCCNEKSTGILYKSPSDAVKAPHEKVIFVTCPSVSEPKRSDTLMTVDVDPNSETYCKVLCKLEFPYIGDEVHHTGWNACASCYGNSEVKRNNLIIPCLHGNRVYVVNTENPNKLKLAHIVEPNEFEPLNVTFLHTTHCLADGNIMISTLGNNDGNNNGEFVLLDSKDFSVKGKWNAEGHKTEFAYDYWYQPRKNVMMSTEWGNPNMIKTGFNPAHVGEGHYGNKVYVWDWTTHKIIQTLTLEGPTGLIPLEVRFYHEPTQPHAFVGVALGSSIYHIYQENDDEPYEKRVAAVVPPRKVEGWVLDEMPGLITDIILSMDDRFLYISCWLHGEIWQYNVTDPFDVKLVGKVVVGGLLHNQSGIRVLDENFISYDQTTIKGRTIYGGPQMMQLSLDGKRLYVTTSLYTIWDQQFYPDLNEKGSVMLMLDVDTTNGGIRLNQDFLIDFGILEGGPYGAHEMRYPGGDCTSDIWL